MYSTDTSRWVQVGGSLRKCSSANANTAQTREDSLADCKAQATARGHPWVSFKTGQGHCFTAAEDDCSEDTLLATNGYWATYYYYPAVAGSRYDVMTEVLEPGGHTASVAITIATC